MIVGCGDLTILLVGLGFHCFLLKCKEKLRHSLGRPSRSDFVQAELEKLNYYAWARFLEQINDDNVLMRVIDKLELATPKREDLSVYREILRKEFEEDTCFYCGKKLGKNIHVDHFIPWSFVKDDKLWNFVLSCARCNERKSNKLPKQDFLIKIEQRNKGIQVVDNIIVQKDFERYSQDLLNRMWKYAKMSGLKEVEMRT